MNLRHNQRVSSCRLTELIGSERKIWLCCCQQTRPIENECMAKTHTDNETPTDAENPYLPPARPTARFKGSDEHSRDGATIIAANVALIPIYLLVLVASVIELAGVKDITSRGAVDYWRHAIASLTFLGICGATLHLARRRSQLAKYSLIAFPNAPGGHDLSRTQRSLECDRSPD